MPTSKPFDLSYVGPCMEEWRRLAGLPPERAEVPNFGGPALEEILEKQARDQREQAAQQKAFERRIDAAASLAAMPPQKRKRRRPDDWMKEAVRASGVSYASVPMPDQCPRVGERVLVRITEGLTANGMQGGGVYQGIVESTEGDLARVRVPDIGRLITLSVSHLIREGVEAIPMDRKRAAPCPFHVGDRVRVARGSGRHSFADQIGVVDVVMEGPRQCDVRFPTIMNKTYGFKWDDLDMWEMRTSPISKKEACANLKRQNENGDVFSMLPVWIDPATMPQDTWAATLELKGGRVLDIPAPDPAIWEQVTEKRWNSEEGVRVQLRVETKVSDVEMRCFSPGQNGGGIYLLGHDAARCWAHDMARVVNEQGPVGMDQKERGALLRSLRSYRRRPPVDPHADRAFPTLRAYLW